MLLSENWKEGESTYNRKSERGKEREGKRVSEREAKSGGKVKSESAKDKKQVNCYTSERERASPSDSFSIRLFLHQTLSP